MSTGADPDARPRTPPSPTGGSAGPMPGSGARALRAAIWLPGLAVAVGAAAATAHGLYETAVAARVPAGIAWLYPLITDGLALVAYAATARLTGSAARYAWAVVVLAAGLSGLAQASLPRRATPALDASAGAAVRGRRLARDRRRDHRAPALPPRHPPPPPRGRRPAAVRRGRSTRRRPARPRRCPTRRASRSTRSVPSPAGSTAARPSRLTGPSRRPSATGDRPGEQPGRDRPVGADVAGAGPGAGGRGAARRPPRRPAHRHRARCAWPRSPAAPPPPPSRPSASTPSRCTSSPTTPTETASHDPEHHPSAPARAPNTRATDPIRATRTATKHYSIKPSDNRIRTTTATRSKDSHLCITIHGSGPAFGRPDARSARS